MYLLYTVCVYFVCCYLFGVCLLLRLVHRKRLGFLFLKPTTYLARNSHPLYKPIEAFMRHNSFVTTSGIHRIGAHRG